MSDYCPACQQPIDSRDDEGRAHCPKCGQPVLDVSNAEPAKPALRETTTAIAADMASLKTTLRPAKSIHGGQQRGRRKTTSIMLNLTVFLIVGGPLLWLNTRSLDRLVAKSQIDTEYGWPLVFCRIQRGTKLLYQFQDSTDPYAPTLIGREGDRVHYRVGEYEGEWHDWEQRVDDPANLLLDIAIAIALIVAACYLATQALSAWSQVIAGFRERRDSLAGKGSQ